MIEQVINLASYFNGKTDLLDRAILSIRSVRPHLNSVLPYTFYQRDKFIQIWINTSACKFSLSGKCSICDYWNGGYSKDSVNQVCMFIESYGSQYSTILINTCGSCFCEEEIPFDELFRIVQSITKTTIKCVILESHLAYINLYKLNMIVNILHDKELIIEYGQESTSPEVLRYSLNKPSMLHEYDLLDSIHALGVKVFANIILGAPFLSIRQRINDSVNSIRNLLDNSVDGIVLFPVNIKPHTLVKFLYDKGFYERVNGIEIVKVLENFCEDDLSKIELAWFEPDREMLAAYEERGLCPYYCEHYGEKILNALNSYCAKEDGASRRKCIQKLKDISCECTETIFQDNYPDIKKCYEFLEDNFLRGGAIVTN